MIGVGLFEFFSLIEKKHIPIYKYFGILVGILIPVVVYLEIELTTGWELLFMVAICLAIFVLQLARPKSDKAIIGVSTTIFGIFYISWFFSFVIKLKLMPYGTGLVAFLILVTKMGDIGSYIVGSAIGRKTLIKRISPKKTWEGAVGGFVFSMLTAYLAKPIMPYADTFHILLLGGLLAVASQVGDLYESLIKRDCEVKDSGKLFPGLGGMLDIIDSALFTAPIFYFYVKFLL